MRKVKFYFGKRRLKHTWGIDFECRTGKWWAVPQILRGYFMREYQAYAERVGIKMLDNGVVGANTFSTQRHYSSSMDGGPIITEPSGPRKTYYATPQVGPVDAKGSPLPLTEQCMTPQGRAFLEKILKIPAERSAAPEKVGTIRYCDYELERTPEMQAVYDEAVAKVIKD